MKCTVLDCVTYFEDSDRISECHYDVFHGVAGRSGLWSPWNLDATLCNGVREPLHIVRSFHFCPDICRPAENLVVSENVRQELDGTANIEFLEVTFERLVDFFYEKGDFSCYEQSTKEGSLPFEPSWFIRTLPDHPDKHAMATRYFELIVARNREIRDRYPGASEIVVDIGPTKFDEPLRFSANAAMIRDYPIQYCRASEWIMADQIYSRIAPYLDSDYFVTKSVEIGD